MEKMYFREIMILVAIFFSIFVSAEGLDQSGNIKVVVENIKSTDGKIMIGIGDMKDMVNMKGSMVEITGESVSSGFCDLPLGKTNVYVFHDANGNNNLDLGKNGIPLEGCAISEAVITEDEAEITIILKYYDPEN